MSTPLDFTNLEKTISITFTSKDILLEALTHRSATRGKKGRKHNERLEFLGDAALELATTEFLFENREKNEGELTNWRAALVCGENLASIAREINLGQYLYMSSGEEASGGRDKDSTLANAMEALIGAIHQDQGMNTVRSFCRTFIFPHLKSLLHKGKDRDHKSLFQEKVQEQSGITPHYDTVSAEGPDHEKIFTCAVFVGNKKIAEGQGNSKQKAEQAAAENALKEG